jgi:protoporphyrinogen oxidase
VIIGAGMTGLAAGRASGATVYEAARSPGGICSSYYVRPGATERLHEAPADGEAYRFELGGGRWIFGGDDHLLELMERLSPTTRHERRAAVIVGDPATRVPYPLQHNLHALGPAIAQQALAEITTAHRSGTTLRPGSDAGTMRDWLLRSFGPTLTNLFFDPFNRRYTDGLFDVIAPQDGYKSPIDLAAVGRGAHGPATTPVVGQAGYNATFAYPTLGLDHLTRQLADGVDVSYDSEVVRVDTMRHVLLLADGREIPFGAAISTVPLDRALTMAGLDRPALADPYTSVFVLNIGAVRGERCPDEHWVYEADSVSGFHRVGFYDNVDQSFLPASTRDRHRRAALYVERACQGDSRPKPAALIRYTNEVVIELQARGWIGRTEVVDPTWIDVAYTWNRPGSTWREDSIAALEEVGIHQVGRYGRWEFQGIADSIRDGLRSGAALRDA